MAASDHHRHPLTTPVFWATIAMLLVYACAGALVMAGAGPSAVGRIVGVLEALVLLAIGAIFAIALAKPDWLRPFINDDNS
jgi:hypothetical protein